MNDIDIKDIGTIAKVPVKVSVVLGKAKMTLSELMEMKEGEIIELDKNVGEDVDIYVNDNLVARGEVVVEGNMLSVMMTEILGDADK